MIHLKWSTNLNIECDTFYSIFPVYCKLLNCTTCALNPDRDIWLLQYYTGLKKMINCEIVFWLFYDSVGKCSLLSSYTVFFNNITNIIQWLGNRAYKQSPTPVPPAGLSHPWPTASAVTHKRKKKHNGSRRLG